MPSPFPGMDPYLEGHEWPDIHHALASEIRRQLMPQLRPKYIARIETSTIQDKSPESEIGILFPNVHVTQSRRGLQSASRTTSSVAVADAPIQPALTVPLLDFQVKLHTVEIRTVGDLQLVTCIEILSPYNKKQPGIEEFLRKRARLQAAGVHLLDIDLLRRGLRPVSLPGYFQSTELDDADYLVMLTRAHADKLELWPFQVDQAMPTVAVPLRAPDPDVPLNLQAVLATIYDEAGYDLSIDYAQPPPPPSFDPESTVWMNQVLAPYRTS